jgi:protein tyrosine/serine phosphatase
MDTIFRGDLLSPGGRTLAWVDSLLIDHALLRLVWSNFSTVVPGRLYRSNHPTPSRLAAQVRRHGIRTLVNLRGRCGNGSDALSRAQAARLGICFIDAPFSGGRAPSREQMLALAEAYRHAPEPILIHCKSGADRAGFAAALFLVLEGASVAQALRQLTLRHGHLRRSRAGVLDAVLLRFAREAEGRRGFIDWLRADYDPDALARDFVPGRLADFVTSRLLARQ